MSQEPINSNPPPELEAYSAYLKRQEKIANWFYGTLIVGCFLAIIVAGVMWIRGLITQ